ncbi:hypothetical protein FKN13_13945 [Vibrio sp. 2-2(9)]|nr:hypothetical protein [Vibrio alginolyticus]NNN50380.1 hypothetical protein [Vibrio sp. 2-2(7)]NNN88553.1 hypothetical protein [Vibrio sp. 2-2(9)]QCO88153.1 hypothetical protein D3H41_19245 [Vibrio neocaledonicus]WAG28343.1 hypothetical protein EEA47_18525 [Vibrio alginolyticus]
MYFIISLVVFFLLYIRTKPNSWCAGIHIVSHIFIVAFCPAIYVVQYLIVTFFSSPILIKLSSRSGVYNILIAFLPSLIATGSLAFS